MSFDACYADSDGIVDNHMNKIYVPRDICYANFILIVLLLVYYSDEDIGGCRITILKPC